MLWLEVVNWLVAVDVFSGGHLLVSPSGDNCWLDQLATEIGREDWSIAWQAR